MKRGEGLPYGEGDASNDGSSTNQSVGTGERARGLGGALLAREREKCLSD